MLRTLISDNPLILTEGAVIERVKREFKYELNQYIENAGMIYDTIGKKILDKIYNQYISVAYKYNLPILILAPTWRANQERLELAGFKDKKVNIDCVKFLLNIRDNYGQFANKILIGGLMACKGDAYNPEDAISSDEAYKFHKFQVEELSKSGVDFLLGSTLPASSEALGMAKAMAESNIDYVLSFIIRPNGKLLDNTSLNDTISVIDNSVSPKPFYYMLNCIHPTQCISAINNEPNNTELVRTRLKALQANGSAMSPEELESLEKTSSESPNIWGRKIIDLYLNSNIKILGGCCGTNHHHIFSIAKIFKKISL
ncbi:MAG: homocysteine S-methyltransferase family protein [Candidatus Odinarchaeota archaeon]